MMNISEIDKNFQVRTIQNKRIMLLNVTDKPFRLYGTSSDKDFRRMDENAAKGVSEGVYELHTKTAGVRVRFKTDSDVIAIRAIMPHPTYLSSMTAVASAGFDMYTDGEFSGAFPPPIDFGRNIYNFGTDNPFEAVIELPSKKMREILINFPLYSDVYKVMVGVSEDAVVLEGTDYTIKKPIVFYGSSISQGACASRPGNTYEAILSRWLDSDYINLGFSGNARGEAIMADYISKIDMSAFVYGYDHNTPSFEHLKNTHKRMYDIIRKSSPLLPIIIVTRPNPESAYIDPVHTVMRRDIIYNTYKSAIDAGDGNVYFVDGKDIYDYADRGIFTSDGVHPNDFGFWCMAKVIGSVLKNVIK